MVACLSSQSGVAVADMGPESPMSMPEHACCSRAQPVILVRVPDWPHLCRLSWHPSGMDMVKLSYSPPPDKSDTIDCSRDSMVPMDDSMTSVMAWFRAVAIVVSLATALIRSVVLDGCLVNDVLDL